MVVGLLLTGLVIHRYYKEFQGSLEGFVSSTPILTGSGEPSGIEARPLATAFSSTYEKLVESDTLVPQTEEEAVANWSKMTSERCFRRDLGEQLKKTGSYLQRTNNYQHSYPDSCSAPNHEFVGTFYRPQEGVGSTPKSGLPLPPSTQCL
jgi:hypothetical protein